MTQPIMSLYSYMVLATQSTITLGGLSFRPVTHKARVAKL